MIASLASLETAKANRANREAAARLLVTDSAERFNLAVDRVTSILHAAQRRGPEGCRRAAAAIGAGSAAAVFDGAGRLVCSSRPLTASLPLRRTDTAPIVLIDGEDDAVRVIASSSETPGWAMAELPRELLAEAAHPHALDGSYSLRLSDATGQQINVATMQTVPLGRDVLADLPIAGGQLRLSMTVATAPLSANEILLTLLPILMWVAGAAIGWLVVDRLILRPLASMQDAIEHYRITGRFEMPPLTTPAFEIRTLGRAFLRAAMTISRHEAELEDGLARQTRLTREVHHRVKNNLQVIASLLNIHARSAETPEAIDAFATIQRRVDALAIVHRSHFAEMEVNHGIALRPMIGELASNLRASVPAGAAPPSVTLDLAQSFVHQDVAVSVAFLLVELIETAMMRVPGTSIAISLDEMEDQPERARLTARSPALRRDAAPVDPHFEQFERVIGGLARQLRSPLERDEGIGIVAIEIMVMPDPNLP
ncbi:sensor histidine kinase [Sphingomonas sp. PR090111-T3T-6A]|uniref:sensor histidine kinase n=1 Tax=Sphingomonas sp. PR090111-T3T-6A TaxID=685778 RepID=UPI00037B0BB7|nr:histidine kinase dimerization/phosphoacceptor domain -containing protein [Sphingomonas sp. PR090111-T3T-6A]